MSGWRKLAPARARRVFTILTAGLLTSVTGCTGGGPNNAEQAQRQRIRGEAPGVFNNVAGFDSTDPARVFADPDELSGAPMTRTLPIEGADPRLSPGRDPLPARPAHADPPSESAASTGGWAIVLDRISGVQHRARAEERAVALRRALGRSDVSVRTVSSGSAVVMGGYAGPEEERAQRDLQYVKSLTIQGTRPYGMAMLVPPPVEAGTNPKHSLIVAGQNLEPIYTHSLQVAVFAGDETKRRADAERYCARLRGEGHEAYYYHGRRVSSVTIGTFTVRDFDLDTGMISPRLERLQEQFPYNLYNGEIQRDPAYGDKWNSVLVQIPRTR